MTPLHVESTLLVKSPARCDSALLVLNSVQAESSSFIQHSSCLGFLALATGTACPGSVFSLSVAESCQLDVPLSARTPTQPASLISAPNVAHVGPSAPTQSLSRAEVMVPLLACGGSGSPLSLRQMSRVSFAMSLVGLACAGSSLPALDSTGLGAPFPLHSHSCLGPVLLMPSFAKADLPMPPRNLACLGLPLSVTGMSRADPVFVLPVAADVHLDALPLLQSSGRLDPSLPALNSCHTDSPLSLRSFSRLALVVSCMRACHAGFVLLLRQYACADSFMPTSGLLCLEASFSVSELATISSIPPARSSVCSGFPLPVPEPCKVNSSFPVQGSG